MYYFLGLSSILFMCSRDSAFKGKPASFENAYQGE